MTENKTEQEVKPPKRLVTQRELPIEEWFTAVDMDFDDDDPTPPPIRGRPRRSKEDRPPVRHSSAR
ncbi:MAG: hypothetical protein AAF636_19210 [Pseudomonadota bacterium]